MDFYRAIVGRVLPTEMSCVSFCDCGDATVVQNKLLKRLPAKFRQMPKQAVHARLHGKYWIRNAIDV